MASRSQALTYVLAGGAGGILLSFLWRRFRDERRARRSGLENASLPLWVPQSQLAPISFDDSPHEFRRLRKAEAVLGRRTGALIIVIERFQDGHNFSAVLRTMENLGVQHVWIVQPPPLDTKATVRRSQLIQVAENGSCNRVRQRALEILHANREADFEEDLQHTAFAKRAQRWLSIREFATAVECVTALRAERRTIWVTALEQTAHVLAPGAPWIEQDFPASIPKHLALVLGAEESGVSQTFKTAADRLVYLPLCGFAESLNVSVAAALATQLILQLLAKAYHADELRLSKEEEHSLRKDWYAKLANSDDERERFMSLLASPPAAFDDLRRPEAARVAWVSKKPDN